MRKFPPKFSLSFENEYTSLVTFENNNDCIIVKDRNGYILDISPSLPSRKIRRILKKT